MATKNKSAFVSSLAKSGTLKKALKAAREAKDDRKVPSIPAGSYVAKLTKIMSTEDDKEKKPVVKATLVVKGGDNDGDVLPIKWQLFGYDGGTWKRTEEEAWSRFSVDVQRMGGDTDWNTADDVEAAIAELAADKPEVKITVTRKPGKDWPTVYINGLVEEGDDDEEGDDEEGDDADDEGDDAADDDEGDDDTDDADDEGDSDEEGDDESDDEEEEIVIAKKDQVHYKPINGKKALLMNVLSSNARKKTCDLIDPSTKKKYSGVAWGSVKPLVE